MPGCGATYTLRHTLFLSDISTHLSHLHHLSIGVAKSILCATPNFAYFFRNTKPCMADEERKETKMNEQLLILISRQLDELTEMLVKQQKVPQGKMGRPTKEHIVIRYRECYPEVGKRRCSRDTGLSIKTVSKYWDLYAQSELYTTQKAEIALEEA